MRRFPLAVVLACTAAGFAAGAGVATWLAPASGRQATAPAPTLAAAPAGGARAGAAGATIWERTPVPQEGAPAIAPGAPAPAASGGQMLEEHALREAALRDPTQLRRLVQRLETDTDPAAREQAKVVLGSINHPEALAAMRRLAASPDVARRQDAYQMLQHAPDAPEVRALLRQAIATEQTPGALAQAVAALRPGPAEPAEVEATVTQLQSLTRHADPAVRAQSLSQLAQWDRTGEGRYAPSLADPVPAVRQAAVFAIAQSGTREPAAKAALIALAQNAGESRELRGSALQVLERFPLTREEYAVLGQVRSRLAP